VRNLIILGAGPHAHEMADMVQQVNCIAPTWNLLGFLVPKRQADHVGMTLLGDYCVLGTYILADQYADALLLPEYGCGATDFPRDRLASLVAPSAFVASTARIGHGCVIYPGCFVGHNAVLGDRVFVLSGSVINHDDYLEDDVTLCSHVSLAGSVHVETRAYLGQACTVRQFLRIGRDSLVGMGSVVVADVPSNVVMVGNPAHKLRDKNP
jgi:acetyltransferase EpsM